MIEGAIRTVAVVASLIVATAFLLFAIDELSGASQRQQSALADAAPPQTSPARHTGVRGAIDQADEQLLRPFAGIVPSSNAWVERGVPALLALLVYGMGLGFLARYIRARA